MKKILTILICLTISLCMVGCGNKSVEEVPKNAAYLVTYSSMFKPEGGFYYVDANGDILGKQRKLKMQDLSRFEVQNDRIIVSGERRNNTLILNRHSSILDSSLVFLNNPKYSGVTAIASDGDDVLGVMNGSFQEGIYKNLYVLQKPSGEVINQYPLSIFAHKALYSESRTVIAGAYIETTDSSMLTIAELLNCTNDDIKTYKYDEYNGFWDIVYYEDVFYCLAEQKNESRNTVVMIDATNYSIMAELTLNDGLINLFTCNNSVYAIGNSGIYLITSLNEGVKQIFNFDEKVHTNDLYASFAYELDGKAYVFLRYSQRQKEGGNYIYGYMLQIDLVSGSMEVTQIKSAKENRVDTLFIIPAAFIQ